MEQNTQWIVITFQFVIQKYVWYKTYLIRFFLKWKSEVNVYLFQNNKCSPESLSQLMEIPVPKKSPASSRH